MMLSAVFNCICIYGLPLSGSFKVFSFTTTHVLFVTVYIWPCT